MFDRLFDGMGSLINEYILEPAFDTTVGELYQDSLLESAYETVSGALTTELYRAGGDEMGAGRPVSIASIAKDFAGGFLNVGASGSSIYRSGSVKMPTVQKVSAPRSQTGNIRFTPTQVNLMNNMGMTNAVASSLAKAAVSNVPSIKATIDGLIRSVNRRSGVKTRLGGSAVGKIATKTTMPYSRKPKYFS